MASPGDLPTPGVVPPPRPVGVGEERGAGFPARATAAFPPASTYAPVAGTAEEEERLLAGRTSAIGLHIPGASTLYILLGLLLLAAGVLCLIMPYKLTDWFFRHHLKHADVLYEELWRILAACLFTGAITCYGLKVASDRRQLNDYAVQRLQHGLFWFAMLTILLHLVHLLFAKSLTFMGLIIGAVVMGATLLVPATHLGMSGGFSLAPLWEGTAVCLRNLFAPRRVSTTVFLYALLTLMFTLAGAMYIIIPKPTLKWTFGYDEGRRTVFLWQVIGAALLTLFPGITYTCEERTIHGQLHRALPKALNVGLLVASLFHILEFGTLLIDGGIENRWLLVVLFVHWLLTLLTSILGLSASEPTPAQAYEYEPLPGPGGMGAAGMA